MNSLDELFCKINEKIEHTTLKNLRHLLQEYNGDDWRAHCSFSEYRYKRNLVFKNDNMEMLIICWGPYQKSGVHDHPDRGCLVKVLCGELVEDVYKKTDDDMECIKSTTMGTNEIAYQIGKSELHNILNKTNKNVVTLHIYSPSEYKPNFFMT